MAIDIWQQVGELVKTGAAVFAVKLVDAWWKKRKQNNDVVRNNLDSDYDRSKAVTAILEDIRFELKCDRVCESSFSNGDVTFSGIHMKKLSITAETEHEQPLSPHLQLVPVKMYGRNMDLLYESKDEYAVLQEHNKLDELSQLNKKFGMLSMLSVKLRDDKGRWIGLVTACWDKPHKPTSEQIAYMKMMVSRIPTKTKQ